jgi:hypothetical protein
MIPFDPSIACCVRFVIILLLSSFAFCSSIGISQSFSNWLTLYFSGCCKTMPLLLCRIWVTWSLSDGCLCLPPKWLRPYSWCDLDHCPTISSLMWLTTHSTIWAVLGTCMTNFFSDLSFHYRFSRIFCHSKWSMQISHVLQWSVQQQAHTSAQRPQRHLPGRAVWI